MVCVSVCVWASHTEESLSGSDVLPLLHRKRLGPKSSSTKTLGTRTSDSFGQKQEEIRRNMKNEQLEKQPSEGL